MNLKRVAIADLLLLVLGATILLGMKYYERPANLNVSYSENARQEIFTESERFWGINLKHDLTMH